MISISIFGSCVSRDSVEYNKDQFNLVDYYARSSFASFCSKAYTGDLAMLAQMNSPFQKKMVERDLNKSALKNEAFKNVDVVLIDLIDERFELVQFDEHEFATRSLELSKIVKDRKGISYLSTDSLKYFRLFEKGFLKFINATNIDLAKIRIIQTYWALENSEGKSTLSEYRVSNNLKLDILYFILRKHLPKSCFISIPNSLLVANVDHKWGDAPYHYVNEFYKFVVDSLKRNV